MTNINAGPLWQIYMKAANPTTWSEVFAFYLTKTTNGSFVDFNGYLPDRIRTSMALTWIPLNVDFFYAVQCQGMGFGVVTDPKNTFIFKKSTDDTIPEAAR